MAAEIPYFKNSPKKMLSWERKAFFFDSTPYGGAVTPTNVTAYMKELPDMKDVSSAKLSGTASVASYTITLPIAQNLERGKEYELWVSFIKSGNTFGAILHLICPR